MRLSKSIEARRGFTPTIERSRARRNSKERQFALAARVFAAPGESDALRMPSSRSVENSAVGSTQHEPPPPPYHQIQEAGPEHSAKELQLQRVATALLSQQQQGLNVYGVPRTSGAGGTWQQPLTYESDPASARDEMGGHVTQGDHLMRRKARQQMGGAARMMEGQVQPMRL